MAHCNIDSNRTMISISPITEPEVSRYELVNKEKAVGATYTPRILADFVADQIISVASLDQIKGAIRILDPAVGDGELLVSLLSNMNSSDISKVEVHGFETDNQAIREAESRLTSLFPQAVIKLDNSSFLDYLLDDLCLQDSNSLFEEKSLPCFDLIIANPPYVRTQVMGAKRAQIIAKQFGLNGRIDLYYAFIIGMAHVLKPGGIGGFIVSNRFMTTKSGGVVREALRKYFNIQKVWDLGDTKIFDAAVLPAVLLVEKQLRPDSTYTLFTSIYESEAEPSQKVNDVIAGLSCDGIIEINDGRRFSVKNGALDMSTSHDAVWRVATKACDDWLATVARKTWGVFGEIGKIRVGVKTCADKVFIRKDWDDMPESERPELLRPLTTHHIAGCFRAETPNTEQYQILYTHEHINGKRRAIDISAYPRTRSYLEKHRQTLERRSYVIKSGRQWYEIWVPQNPELWKYPKLVFRDISEEPTFWIDLDGTIVNGDCYWLTCDNQKDIDLLWLAAAVANSSFIKVFYDHSFNNKLYAGRRRFITQYVERFPIPDPTLPSSKNIIALARLIYENCSSADSKALITKIDSLVWDSFGVSIKEVIR